MYTRAIYNDRSVSLSSNKCSVSLKAGDIVVLEYAFA